MCSDEAPQKNWEMIKEGIVRLPGGDPERVTVAEWNGSGIKVTLSAWMDAVEARDEGGGDDADSYMYVAPNPSCPTCVSGRRRAQLCTRWRHAAGGDANRVWQMKQMEGGGRDEA
ncbi:hypothetical protein B0H17DRAFT_1141583 [Mycena rosella]|uniref:Uncharacterized protein n=1 Tax=Mycena rosella TaxID=1033263 RepID=A0AAD7CZE7_MYCRO|nr:hypothetical protein B0H17DRAFT_1141583 [Mycena rosella]